MKLKRTAAITLAALTAVSASICAFAEETKNEPAKLLTSELTADLKTNMVFAEEIGVVDITGAIFDSSENGNADENANLDVDFDGIAYLSKENLKVWQETGVLTLSKLKADFDTTGLKWGMFNAENGYVQLVKMDGDTVTYRGLYKIEDSEIKKLCDLSTFWTYTRADGVSVGFEVEMTTGNVKDEYDPTYTYEITEWTELKMITTQPDGTRKETVIAKNDVEFDGKTTGKVVDASGSGVVAFSVLSKGDVLANIGLAISDSPTTGFEYKIWQISKDGAIKEIYNGSDRFAGGVRSWYDGSVVWYQCYLTTSVEETLKIYYYNAKTGKIESYGYTADSDWNWFGQKSNNQYLRNKIDFKGGSDNNFVVDINAYTQSFDGSSAKTTLADGYAILHGLNDFDNWASKTYYKNIHEYYVNDGNGIKYLYKFETKDGKKGYMDGNEKVLGYFDKVGGFMGDNFAPVVKNGKAYLIDKNMNAVSTEIAADDVVALDDDLFIAKNGDKTYVVTYAGDIKAPAGGNAPATEAVVVDYSDNGVTASAEKGVIANGAALSVKAVEDKTNDKNVTYEISFKNGDKEVQPNGKVTVKIPVPDAFKDKTIYVYRVEGDKYVDMKAKVENGFVVFETSHFSEYVLTTEKHADAVSDKDNPDTGAAGIALTLGLATLAGAAVVVYRKRK